MAKPNKHERGSIQITRLNTAPAEQVMRLNGTIDVYNQAYAQGLYGKCWRMVLATGLKLEPRPVAKEAAGKK